jgi:hypothetical protein
MHFCTNNNHILSSVSDDKMRKPNGVWKSRRVERRNVVIVVSIMFTLRLQNYCQFGPIDKCKCCPEAKDQLQRERSGYPKACDS